MKKNCVGKIYLPGKPYSKEERALVLDKFNRGESYAVISEKCGITKEGCRKIVQRAIQTQSLNSRFTGGKKYTVRTAEIVSFVEYMKFQSPSMYASEIRQKLLDRGICNNQNLPCLTVINDIIKNDLGMTRKVIQQLPSEAMTARNDILLQQYMASLSTYKPEQIHFFDECSVVRTAGNRKYGHSERGTRACEVQRYASNVTYTVNLLCGYFALDHFDILQGASNALEMLNFFQQAVVETNFVGNPTLSPGDVVVMDNCGFHHHRVIEGQLRNLLAQHGVSLLFQPPYSPELNVCEYIFRMMRSKLQKSDTLTYNFTELAITRALTRLNPRSFANLYRKCGYV